MYKLIHSRSFYIVTALIVIGVIILMMLGVGQNTPVERVTTTVESGPVRQLVSVSGIAEAEQSAELAFPVSGIVRTVNVKKGDVVQAGTILIELERQALLADRQEAVARVTQAVSERDELISGPTNSARDVTTQTLAQVQEALQTTRENEARKIENAYQTLLSSGLTVYSDDPDENAVPPTVSGSYVCGVEGSYRIEPYNSGAQSGYSYRLSGIESGTYPVSTQQAIALGDCGLRIQFDPNSNYSRTVWNIDIPNKKSTAYISNRNTYALTVTQAEGAIKNAEQAVALAQANATDENAAPRNEALTRADATITQAQAGLTRIDAMLNDRVIRAPFSGTITEIDILPGETVTAEPVVTLLAASDFEITARIPEIDIGKLLIGQKVEMVFDAKSDEPLTGAVDFISLKATEIDGVAYYEALITLNTAPVWLRSGLNADIDIIIAEASDALRVPKRFVRQTDTGYEVVKQTGETIATTTIKVQLEGNDGYIAIIGLNEGDVLVAP